MWKPGYRMLILVAVIAVVSGVILWIVASQMDMMSKDEAADETSIQNEFTGITTLNASEVTDIELSSPDGKSLKLHNENGTWTMNGDTVPQEKVDKYFKGLSSASINQSAGTKVPDEEPAHTATYRLQNGEPVFVNFWNHEGKWTMQSSSTGQGAFQSDSDDWFRTTMADSTYFQ